MKENKFKCSICGTVYDTNLYNQKNIYNTIVMKCPKDGGVCWPYEETNDFEQLKSLLLEQYTKEELWAMLEKIRAKKATLKKNTFNNIRKGE